MIIVTKEEVIKILAIVNVAYPRFQEQYKTEQQKKMLIELWHMQFKDYSYNAVAMGLNAFISIDTKGFPCTIGQLKELIYNMTNQDSGMTEQEAWNMVYKAICNSGYHSEKEFNNLPQELQKLVGSSHQLYEWSQMTTNEVTTVIASNFMRSYKARKAVNKEYALIPSEVKQMIEQVAVKGIEG